MNYRFHPDAERELSDAITYYQAQRHELGGEFLRDVEASIESIRTDPLQFAILEDEVRIARTKRFPYGLIFAADENGILILAVMHLHRRPGYWKHRLR